MTAQVKEKTGYDFINAFNKSAAFLIPSVGMATAAAVTQNPVLGAVSLITGASGIYSFVSNLRP